MTPEQILEQRRAIVADAKSWIGTKYVLGGKVKGAGTDCANFVYSVYRACGLVPDEHLGVFSHDWYCHRTEESYLDRVRYLLQLRKQAYKTAEAVAYRSTVAASGSIVLVRAAGSRLYNHGGIVTVWPQIIHAIAPAVQACDASRDEMWAFHPICILDPFGATA